MGHAFERGYSQRQRFADAFKRERAINRRNLSAIEIDLIRGKGGGRVLSGIQKIRTLDMFVKLCKARIDRGCVDGDIH